MHKNRWFCGWFRFRIRSRILTDRLMQEPSRARGRMGRRPKTDPNIIKKATKLYRTGQYSIKEIEELAGVKKSILYRNLQVNTNEER